MRDVFLTCRSFFKRISDFVKYRTATRDMNERYPDATAEEIAREDTCIICREEMRPYALLNPGNGAPEQAVRNPVAERMRPKKLPCGHILHFACLRSWLERQQICPTCRRPVVPNGRTAPLVAGQPAANAVAGQPGAAVPGQPVADQARQGAGQPAEGQNRFRMLNLGPLRIGFGAGRGDLVNDLAHEINDQARPLPNGNPDHAQQFGFGFGFGRPRAPPARSGNTSVHTQLNAIEQRLQQDISELRMAANELHVVRMLEAELNRLRTLRQAAAGQPVPTPTTILQAPAAGSVPPVAIRPPQALVASSQQPILTAGSEALPEGLTLPRGWTMMPLQRVDAMGHPATSAMSNSTSSSGNPPTMSAQGRTSSPHASSLHPTTSQPPPYRDIRLPSPSLMSHLNDLGQTHPTAGSSDSLNNAVQTSVPSSTLTNGARVVRDVQASNVPANTSSVEAERVMPATTNHDHEDSAGALPTLPTWGSHVPLAPHEPSRLSAVAQNGEENGEEIANGDSPNDGPATAKRLPASAPTEKNTDDDTQQQGVARPPQDKRKIKAVTVEDFVDDVD